MSKKNENVTNEIFQVALDIFTAHDLRELMEPVICDGGISDSEGQQLTQYFSRMQSCKSELKPPAPTDDERATAKDIFLRMMLAHPNWFEATFFQKIKSAPVILM